MINKLNVGMFFSSDKAKLDVRRNMCPKKVKGPEVYGKSTVNDFERKTMNLLGCVGATLYFR